MKNKIFTPEGMQHGYVILKFYNKKTVEDILNFCEVEVQQFHYFINFIVVFD